MNRYGYIISCLAPHVRNPFVYLQILVVLHEGYKSCVEQEYGKVNGPNSTEFDVNHNYYLEHTLMSIRNVCCHGYKDTSLLYKSLLALTPDELEYKLRLMDCDYLLNVLLENREATLQVVDVLDEVFPLGYKWRKL